MKVYAISSKAKDIRGVVQGLNRRRCESDADKQGAALFQPQGAQASPQETPKSDRPAFKWEAFLKVERLCPN